MQILTLLVGLPKLINRGLLIRGWQYVSLPSAKTDNHDNHNNHGNHDNQDNQVYFGASSNMLKHMTFQVRRKGISQFRFGYVWIPPMVSMILTAESKQRLVSKVEPWDLPRVRVICWLAYADGATWPVLTHAWQLSGLQGSSIDMRCYKWRYFTAVIGVLSCYIPTYWGLNPIVLPMKQTPVLH